MTKILNSKIFRLQTLNLFKFIRIGEKKWIAFTFQAKQKIGEKQNMAYIATKVIRESMNKENPETYSESCLFYENSELLLAVNNFLF